MTPEFNGEKEDGRGRPTLGAEPLSTAIKVRMEKEMCVRLTWLCKQMNISREAGIREGILMFLKKYGG